MTYVLSCLKNMDSKQQNEINNIVRAIIKYVQIESYSPDGVTTNSLITALIKDHKPLIHILNEKDKINGTYSYYNEKYGYIRQFYCGYPLKSSNDPKQYNIADIMPIKGDDRCHEQTALNEHYCSTHTDLDIYESMSICLQKANDKEQIIGNRLYICIISPETKKLVLKSTMNHGLFTWKEIKVMDRLKINVVANKYVGKFGNIIDI